MTTDLDQVNALVVVFAMHGCGPCEDYLPKLEAMIKRYQAAGHPFVVMTPSKQLAPGQIPVLIYDAAAEDDGVQAFADKLGVSATPTTCLLTRTSVSKLEGGLEDEDIQRVLVGALQANR